MKKKFSGLPVQLQRQVVVFKTVSWLIVGVLVLRLVSFMLLNPSHWLDTFLERVSDPFFVGGFETYGSLGVESLVLIVCLLFLAAFRWLADTPGVRIFLRTISILISATLVWLVFELSRIAMLPLLPDQDRGELLYSYYDQALPMLLSESISAFLSLGIPEIGYTITKHFLNFCALATVVLLVGALGLVVKGLLETFRKDSGENSSFNSASHAETEPYTVPESTFVRLSRFREAILKTFGVLMLWYSISRIFVSMASFVDGNYELNMTNVLFVFERLWPTGVLALCGTLILLGGTKDKRTSSLVRGPGSILAGFLLGGSLFFGAMLLLLESIGTQNHLQGDLDYYSAFVMRILPTQTASAVILIYASAIAALLFLGLLAIILTIRRLKSPDRR